MSDRESRVFVVQHPARFDVKLKQFVPIADLSGAAKYGHPIYMLPPGNIRARKLPDAIRTLESALFDYCDLDYLLAVGDPVGIAAAVLIAGRKTGGVVNILKWQRLTADYQVFALNLNSGSASHD